MKKKDIEQLGLLYEFVVSKSTPQFQKVGDRFSISTGGGGFKPPPPPDDYDGDSGDDDDDDDDDDEDENPYENGVYDRNRSKSRKAYNTLKEFLHLNTNDGISIAEFYDIFNTIYGFFNFAKTVLPKDEYYEKNVEAMLSKASELPCFVKGFKRIHLEPNYETDMLYKVPFRKPYNPKDSGRKSGNNKDRKEIGGRENDPYIPMPAGILAGLSDVPKGLYFDRGRRGAALDQLHDSLGPGQRSKLEEHYEMPIDKFLSLLSIMWGPEFNSEFKISSKDPKYKEKVVAACRRVERLPSFYLAVIEPDFDKGIVYRISYEGDYKR